MKIRNGFVSNSSSSSFVILGAKIDEFDPSVEDMIDLMDKHDVSYDPKYPEDSFHDAMYNGNFGFSYLGEEKIVGKYLAHGGDCGLDEDEISFTQLEKMAKEVKKDIKNVLGLDVNIKLLTGERCC